MTSTWHRLALVIAAAGASRAGAQQVRELGVQAVVTASDPALVGGGVYAALRPSTRARVAATLTVAGSGGGIAGRGELLAHFLLNPTATTRPGVYLGGGIAGVVGRVDQGYVVALIGVEGAPGRRSGWTLEAGVGGGARLTAGWRWRWRHQPSRK